jgi:pyruvate/2-oxoglutarate/acetoin dehydrogenase E1 component
MPTTSYLDAIREAMLEEMRRDENVFLMGEDVGAYGGAFKVTKGIFEEFGPKRVVDTPISESAIIGVGIGTAIKGLRPICEMQFADFVSSAFNQIVNNAATIYWRMGVKTPMVIRNPSGGNVHGGPFHSQNPEPWFFRVPGLKVVAPATAYDAKGLLKSAIRDDNVVLYFEHKYLYRRIKEELPEDEIIVPIGEAKQVRKGNAATIITYGAQVHDALKASDEVSKEENVEVAVLDLRSLRPFDKTKILEAVKKTNRILVAHEHQLTGGIGGEISAFITENAFEYLDAPIYRVAAKDIPVPFSPPLEEYFYPSKDKIKAKLKELLSF